MADTTEIANHVATSTGLPTDVARAAVMSTLTKVASGPVHTGDGVLLVGGRLGGPQAIPPLNSPPSQTPPQTTSPQTTPPTPAGAVDETKQCPVCGQTLAQGYVCMTVGPGFFLYSSQCGFMKYKFGK